jgi:hypothetical protein
VLIARLLPQSDDGISLCAGGTAYLGPGRVRVTPEGERLRRYDCA